jgi:alpha-glucosidase
MKHTHNEVFYQIYPQTFADGNGDGVGDFIGMRERLGHLTELGVDGAWVSPFYDSPFEDGGYDISDYTSVHPMFGTMQDFREFMAAAKSRDLKVYGDLVISHCSSQHERFVASRHDMADQTFIWHQGQPDAPPNNWLSVFPEWQPDGAGGFKPFKHSAWQWDDVRRQYYLHNFATHQPNWNHEDPAVRHMLKEDAIRFWLREGLSGFRMDAVYYMGHDLQWRNEEANPYYVEGVNSLYTQLKRERSMGDPSTFRYLREYVDVLSEVEFAAADPFMMIEAYPTIDRRDPAYDPIPGYRALYDALPKGRAAPFYFEMTTHWDATAHQKAIEDFMAALQPGDVPVWPLGNHDKRRIASRLEGGLVAARGAAMLQLSLPGKAIIYQGDEYGQPDVPEAFRMQDPFLGRDVARAPMRFDGSINAGFSTAPPDKLVLPVGEGYQELNIEAQQHEPNSTLNLYRRMIALRKSHPALKQADNFQHVQRAHDQTVVFARSAPDGERAGSVLVVANYGNQALTLNMGHVAAKGRVIISSAEVHPAHEELLELDALQVRPHETVLIQTD